MTLMVCLRALTTALLKLSLALPYSETTQPLDILGRVEAVSTGSPSCERQGAKSFAEPQPARGYAELFGRLCDCECLPRVQHAASVYVIR